MLDIILLDEIERHNTLLEAMLKEAVGVLGEEAVYHAVLTAAEAAVLAGQAGPKAVYFLDIELGTEQNGIDVARRIHEEDPDGYIVYVSAYQQYAMECLHSHVFDFLAKPVSSVELTACLKAILKDMKKTPAVQEKKLLISAGSRDYYLPLKDISVIRSRRNFCETIAAGQFCRWKEPLKSVARRLADSRMMQVNRSTLVNLDRVRDINWPERILTLDTDETVVFSRSLGKALQNRERRAQDAS